MGVTSEGIYYPDDTAPIKDLQDHLQQMAESVNDAIAPVAETAASLGIIVAANWSINSFTAARVGIVRALQVNLTYSGPTLTANATGNLTNTLVMSNLPTEWLPNFGAMFPFDQAGNADGAGLINTLGEIQIRTMSPGSSLASGNSIGFNAVYVALS